MHLFNLFSRIQPLRYLHIISVRQFPIEAFLHDAWFVGTFGDFWLLLHALHPLRFSLSLSCFPPPHNPLYQNGSIVIRGIDIFTAIGLTRRNYPDRGLLPL